MLKTENKQLKFVRKQILYENAYVNKKIYRDTIFKTLLFLTKFMLSCQVNLFSKVFKKELLFNKKKYCY